MKTIAKTLSVLLIAFAPATLLADDSLNVNPAGAVGAITPDDQFAGACPRCFAPNKDSKISVYSDLLAGDPSGPTPATKPTGAADGQ